LSAGVTSGGLRRSHIVDVEALVTNWHGQGDVALPGGVAAGRTYGRLTFTSVDMPDVEVRVADSVADVSEQE